MAAPDPAAATPGERYGWYVLAVLVIAYTFSYVDRQILTLMVPAIKKSLNLTDVQVSLLHGLAFAVFYTFLGIPLARLADRRRRTGLIAAGILAWSVMTALCGLARSFGQLFAARAGVGVGEAALSPAAYSLIADSFPVHRLARALSIYTGAIYFGAGIALIAGGTLIGFAPALNIPGIGRLAPWQTVFLIVALPGIPVALLAGTLREPARRELTKMATASRADLLVQLRRHARSYALLIAGYSAAALAWNGATAWLPTMFVRSYGWTTSEIGIKFGAVMLVGGSAGIYSGGALSDRLRLAGMLDSHIVVGIVSALLMMVAGIAFPLMPTGGWALACTALFVFFGSMPYGGAALAFQEITPNRLRAQLSAIYLFGLNLAGIGLGPTLVALLTDKLLVDEHRLYLAVSAISAIGAPLSALLLALARRGYREALGGVRQD